MNQSGSSRTDTIVKVMLVFFISLLSFSVGTFVGKQVSDSDHRRLALESEANGMREVASTHGEDDKVSEKDVENLAEEFVNKEKGGDEHAATDGHGQKSESEDGYKSYGKGAHDAKPAASEKPDKAAAAPADATHVAAGKVAAGHAPTDGKAEPRKPAATLPSVASSTIGKFTVQVSSTMSENEAKEIASQLKNKGWNAFYIPAAINGKTWYRVSVGLFNSATQAKEFRNDFVKESNAKTAIVQKIVQ